MEATPLPLEHTDPIENQSLRTMLAPILKLK